ncbi:hypothetical protein [Sorangium sp. So ce1151]|uniref:hypothetical protein n=1 Tax=Sorangium sp. So ce1151 TaxID=3133332 RepID=UPI003F5EB2BD
MTYFLERQDGSWVAMALRILGQDEGGGWTLGGDFKTVGGECAVLFRSDPGAPAEMPDPTPVQIKLVRRYPSASASDDLASLAEDPTMTVALAMNLLMVRRWPAAAESLSKEARPVRYPCGIDQAHLLVTSGPGYQKHHDLCPRVMLTGVACLSIDGGKNPMTVTSFGLNDPAAQGPTSYEDFVDLSHPKRIDHEGFALTYPATWFLVRQPDQEKDGLHVAVHGAQLGGVSCSLICTVRLYSGDPRRVAEEQQAARSRLSGPLPGLSLRGAEPLLLPGDARGYVFDQVHPAIDGVAYSAVFGTDARDRFARVNTFGCISKTNPRRRETMAEYERVFREVLGSFQFN